MMPKPWWGSGRVVGINVPSRAVLSMISYSLYCGQLLGLCSLQSPASQMRFGGVHSSEGCCDPGYVKTGETCILSDVSSLTVNSVAHEEE